MVQPETILQPVLVVVTLSHTLFTASGKVIRDAEVSQVEKHYDWYMQVQCNPLGKTPDFRQHQSQTNSDGSVLHLTCAFRNKSIAKRWIEDLQRDLHRLPLGAGVRKWCEATPLYIVRYYACNSQRTKEAHQLFGTQVLADDGQLIGRCGLDLLLLDTADTTAPQKTAFQSDNWKKVPPSEMVSIIWTRSETLFHTYGHVSRTTDTYQVISALPAPTPSPSA